MRDEYLESIDKCETGVPKLEVHHESLQGGVDLSGQVAGHHVEGDELVTDAHDVPVHYYCTLHGHTCTLHVPVVTCHLDAEDPELMSLH